MLICILSACVMHSALLVLFQGLQLCFYLASDFVSDFLICLYFFLVLNELVVLLLRVGWFVWLAMVVNVVL